MKKLWIFIIIGLIFSLALAIFLSPYASPSPDGLERVAEKKNFSSKGEGKEVFHSPIADYLIPGIKNEKIATALAGLAGTLVVFVLGFSLAYVLKRRSENK